MYESDYSILLYLSENDGLTTSELCSLTNLNRTTIKRKIIRLNKHLNNFNINIEQAGSKYKINNVSGDNVLCLWNINSKLYDIFMCTLLSNDPKELKHNLQTKYYYTNNQIYYSLNKHYKLNISMIEKMDKFEYLKFTLMQFTYIFNDYSARYVFKEISHQTIVDKINELNINDCSTYEYLILFACELMNVEDKYIKQIYCELKILNNYKYSDSSIYKYYADKNLPINVLTKLGCCINLYQRYLKTGNNLITRNFEFMFHEKLLVYASQYVDEFKKISNITNHYDLYFFCDFFSLLCMEKCYESSNNIINIINVEEASVITNIYNTIVSSFEKEINIKVVPSWKYYNNEDKYENSYSNSFLVSSLKCIPKRNDNNRYNTHDLVN